MKVRFFLIVVCLIGFSARAYSQVYVGAGASVLMYSDERRDRDASPLMLAAIVGLQLNDYISVELRAEKGVAEDQLDGGIDLDVDSYVSGFARAGLPVNEWLYPYLMLGASQGKLSIVTQNSTSKSTLSDLSFGSGLLVGDYEGLHLAIEYINYYYEARPRNEISGFTVSGRYRF